MAKKYKTENGCAVVVGVVLALAVLAFLGSYVAMLIFGAAANEWNHLPGPSYWQTFFGLWSVGIIGASFNGSRYSGTAKK